VLCCYILHLLHLLCIILTTASLLHSADPSVSTDSSTSSLATMLETQVTQLPHAPLATNTICQLTFNIIWLFCALVKKHNLHQRTQLTAKVNWKYLGGEVCLVWIINNEMIWHLLLVSLSFPSLYKVWQESNETDFLLTMNFTLFFYKTMFQLEHGGSKFLWSRPHSKRFWFANTGQTELKGSLYSCHPPTSLWLFVVAMGCPLCYWKR
jgi:hypothetical protein